MPLLLVLTTATPLAHVLRSRTLRVSVDEATPPPSFREVMSEAIDAEKRAIAAADAAQRRTSSRTAVVPATEASATAQRADGGAAQPGAVTGGNGVPRRAIL